MSLYERNLSLLKESGITFREVEHEPVLDYEAASRVRDRFGLTGKESKSVFLRLKDGRYGMFVTVEGKRADLKHIRELTGSRASICSDEELIRETGCVPRCACPFGHKPEILLILDNEVFRYDKLLYSPGPPERTVEVATKDIERLLAGLPNTVLRYDDTRTNLLKETTSPT